MTLSEKLARIHTELESFAAHTDEDAAVRKAGLEAVKRAVDDKIAAIEADVAEQAAVFG